jgi:hypothetical protein
MSQKFDEIVKKYKLGGVMAWSLGEDSYDWSHVRAMAGEVANGVPYQRTAIQDSLDEVLSSDPSPSPTPAVSPYNTIFVDGTEQEPSIPSWPPADAPPSDPDFIATTPIPPTDDNNDAIMLPFEEIDTDESSTPMDLAHLLAVMVDDEESSPDEGGENSVSPSQSSAATQSSGQYYGHGAWPPRPTGAAPAVPEAWINDGEEGDEGVQVELSCRLVRRKKAVGRK